MFTKLFYSVAVLATVTSCSKHVATETVHPNESSIIGFRNLSDRVMPTTKATTTNKSNYLVFSEYSSAADGWYIDGMSVTANGETFDDPAEANYWPDPELDFYAYAPTTRTEASITEKNYDDENCSVAVTDPTDSNQGNVVITYTVPDAADEDFLVADPLRDQTKSSASGIVNYVFNHMLSNVHISVRCEDANYNVSWGNITLAGNKVNSGTVDITTTDPAIYVRTSTSVPDLTYTSTAPTTTAKFMIMPQVTQGFTVTVNNVIATRKLDHKVVDYGNLTYTFIVDDTNVKDFESGKLYNLYFTVAKADDQIKFESTVEDWVVNKSSGTELQDVPNP